MTFISQTITMKNNIFKKIEKQLKSENFTFEKTDFNRPWGGFFVIDEHQSDQFIQRYFPDERIADMTKSGIVSPKILVVAPGRRLSWQYHLLRSEVWMVIEGTVGVVRSNTDEEGAVVVHGVGDKIVLAKGERHRLVGQDEYGILAEIWQHTDPNNLSTEEDIVRVQDDFGR